MKKLMLSLCLCAIALTDISPALATPVHIQSQKSPTSGTYTDGTYFYTVYFDTTGTDVTGVDISGYTVLAFLNQTITYNSGTGQYTVVRFKVRFTDGSTTYESIIPSMTLD